MNQREFMIQYVLNRANTQSGVVTLGGRVAAEQAAEAWRYIDYVASIGEKK